MSVKESLKSKRSNKSSKTILRQAHKKSFTVITNALAQDNSLSLRARGLMLYLLSLPDDWKIHINHLVSILKEGREQVTATLQELKRAKYIHHHKMGFKEGWEYFVFESPTQDDAFKEFLRTIRVSEELAKPNSSGFTPPLQRTKNPYKKTHVKSKDSEESLPPKDRGKKESGPSKTKFPLKKEQKPLFEEMKRFIPDTPVETLMIWIRSYSEGHITAALQTLQESMQKKRVRSAGALMRTFLEGNCVLIDENTKANRAEVQMWIGMEGLSSIELHQKYVICLNTGKEIPLNMDPILFGEQFAKLINLAKIYR